MLGPLQNNGGPTQTHELLSGSPAIDKGDSFGLDKDQRGSDRPFDNAAITNASDGSDIGAFEAAPSTDLEITKRDSADPLTVGASFTYTLRVYNRGPLEASNVVVTDTLPAGLTPTGVSLDASSDFTGAGCTLTGNTVNCALGTMRVFDGTFDSAVKKGKAIVIVDVEATQAGQYTNEATVSADETDNNTSNNTARQPTTVLGISSVEVTPDSVPGGASCQKPVVKVNLTSAPPADIEVEISDDLAATTNIPDSSSPLLLRIPKGQSSARLLVETAEIVALQAGQVTAAFGPSSASAPLTVRPIGIRSLSVSPSSVEGGQQSTGTVKLECSTSEGIQVTLKTGKRNVASFIDPNTGDPVHPLTLTIDGSNQATFTIQTFGVSAPSNVNVRATANGATKNTKLVVTPSPD